jgi:hypothetical protein
MPTIKPRVNITLNQSDYDVLREFCTVTKKSMSSYLSEVVAASVPQMKALVEVVGIARGLEGDALQAFNSELSSVGSCAQSSVMGVSKQLDEVAKGVNPLSLNKGVRLVNKGTNSKSGQVKLFVAAGNVFAEGKGKGGSK